MAIDTNRILIEWDEWDGKVGLIKNYEKKIALIGEGVDLSFLDTKLTKDVKVYVIDQLEGSINEQGNVVLAGSGISIEFQGDQAEIRTAGGSAGEETEPARKRHYKRKKNSSNDSVKKNNEGRNNKKRSKQSV